MFYHLDSIITASRLREAFGGPVAGLPHQTTRLDAIHRANMRCDYRLVCEFYFISLIQKFPAV
jgi:hypothetical protein